MRFIVQACGYSINPRPPLPAACNGPALICISCLRVAAWAAGVGEGRSACGPEELSVERLGSLECCAEADRVMYCAHPVSGTGTNPLMYCYNMKPVSTGIFYFLEVTVPLSVCVCVLMMLLHVFTNKRGRTTLLIYAHSLNAQWKFSVLVLNICF